MQPEQQRIMGYFIEEAKEHLNTIEHGLLNLESVVADPDMLNDVFRAAHSVKGGAAMLGIGSMQQIAHRLEDYFKVLKEHPIKIDQKLESLFFKGFDALSSLTEELQGGYGLSPEVAEQTLQEVEPTFNELHSHLTMLIGPGADLSEYAPTPGGVAEPGSTTVSTVVAVLDPACVAVFQTDVMAQLREMLRLFKLPDNETQRSQLLAVCQDLTEFGQQFQLTNWSTLTEQVALAIANTEQSWDALAQVIVPELKSARDLVLGNRAHDITPTSTLLQMLPPVTEAVPASSEADINWLGLFEEEEATADAQVNQELDSLLDHLLQEPEPSTAITSDLAATRANPTPSELVDLDALLAEGAALPQATISPAPPSADAAVDTDNFDELEQLLEATQSGGGSTSRSTAQPPSRANRRRGFNQTMKVPVKQLDQLSNLVGELLVSRNTLEDSQERLRQFLSNLLFQVQQLNDLGQQMEDLYERSLLERSLLSAAQKQQTGASEEERHATGVDFDALEMDSFTGFHTLSQEMIERIVRVREAASDIEFVIDSTEQVTRMFRQVTSQVQEGLTKSRMVPFGQVAERLPRAVRDISIKCGKQARLELEGRETLIDKSILERLYDPLTHLVNNAIFHGIEYPEVRQSEAKTPEGLIKVRAFYQGNQTVISITDDGAGIDPERIRAKAIENKLITPEQANNLNRQETYSLLFQSGFTTQDKVTDLAGRGVGMDVVRTSINEIRGVINTDSTLGKGTTFTIRLPLTLSITKALCCVHQQSQIAFPIDGVHDVIDLPKDQLEYDADGQLMVTWQEKQLPCRPLGDLLTYNRRLKRSNLYNFKKETEDQISILLLRSADDLVAIQVDQVIGEQEIVIKQLSGPVPKPLGIAGVTVQGDGRVMPIADVLEIVDLCLDRLESTSNLWLSAADIPAIEDTEEDPTVLIVDDSITVRELLSITFAKVGYRVEQARDGMEAWEKLRAGLPCDLVFCDVEMPRMDGLELLSRLQQDPDLQDLPIAMLTSRGAAKHKQMAVDLGAKGYFTKPYLEEALLDAAQRMLEGEVLISK